VSTTASDAAPAGLSISDIECIRDEQRFAQLAGEWNHLAELTDPESVFLRHEWFQSAWQWCRHDSELRVLVATWGDAPVGIVPLILRREHRRRIPVRVLRFLTVPDTQRCAVLAAPHDQASIAAAAIQWLRERRDWDLLDLEYFEPGSSTWECIRQAASRHGLVTAERDSTLNLHIDLTTDWKSFYATRSRRLKKANNLVANHLTRAHPEIEVRWLTRDTLPPEGLEALIEVICGLSARSWKRATGLSLDQPGPSAFIRRLAHHAYANDWLSVWLLELSGTPVAMEFQLIYRGHVHALRADFDEAHATLSPGSYLNWKLLESLFGKGCRRYWMGPGENRYKSHWTESGEHIGRLIIFNRSLRGVVLHIAENRVRPILARLRTLRPSTS
jgi:CelD/BcsL family acetyltransferase involved in cellulose biosynthesis